jgi:carbonic anhydrase
MLLAAAVLATPRGVWANDPPAAEPRAAAPKAGARPAAKADEEAVRPGAEGEKSIKPQIKPPLGASVEAAKKEAEAARAAQARAAGRAPAADTSLDQLRERLNQRVQAVRDAHATTPVVRVPAGTLRPPTRAKAAEGHGAPGKAAPHALHWDYTGPGGPEAWGSLRPEFATCANGERQSPIDIRGGIAVDLEPIRFEYHPSDVAVIDNGHTVQVNVSPGNRITVSGRSYDLVQFHFHRPSEERINGRQFEMVVHLVHRDFEGRLAVVAVLLERGPAHPVVQAVWNDLPLEKGIEQPSTRPMDIEALLPTDRRYYTYMGSLTTPPCSEGVLWLVLKQPAPLSQEQIGVFARLYPMNARPVQRPAGRLIKESN